MRSCEITFKIKDYFPKIDTIPFEEYVCIFINGDFSEKISLIEKDFNTCKHQINSVNSDLKYKIHIVNINDSSLIGICEIIIPYAIISQIDTPGTFIKEQQLKLFIDLKTKRKLFGTLLSTGDIYLYLSAEVFVNNQNIDKKKKNLNKNKNYHKKDFNMINIYGNNNNKNNNNNKKYRVIKTDKDSLRNECKTYTCLKNMTNSNTSTINEYFYAPVSGERKDIHNRQQNNPLGLDIKNNLTIDNNKNTKNQNQKVKKVNTQRKKLTILDLMEQKIKNKKELTNKNNMNNNNNISCRYNKSSSPKEIKNINLENKENYGLNIDKNLYLFSDKAKNNSIYNYDNLLKNAFSPVNNSKNVLPNEKTNYIYKKKSAHKIRTKISENNIFNYNSSSPYAISNFNMFGEIVEKKSSGVKKTKSCFSTKIHKQNQNQKNNQINKSNNLNNANNITDNIFINPFDEKQKLTDLDKNILEKGVSIRNDFQNQLNYSFNQSKYILENTYDDIYNNNNSNRNTLNNLNDIFNIKYNKSQKEFHKTNQNFKSPKIKIDLDSSKNITNITPLSNNHLNTNFTQEDLKKNILNLFDFYSLLKQKINIIKDNLYKNKNKLVIKKEKFNNQLKKNNRLTQKIISVESKIILHANVNNTLNEQIILPLMKIKKIESTLYQNLFGLKYYDYDIIKFREKEKNRLFEEQNIIHLLLIIIKNMIEHYGNISHIYQDDINRKKMLELILLKYEIKEKKDKINMNKNINNNQNVNNNKFKIINSGKSQFIDDEFLNKFKIIREVEEDKEYDDSEEEDKNKKEFKNENELESFEIEENDENNINEIKNEKTIENGATKKESETSIKKYNNKYIDETNEEYNKTNLINKILSEEFPKKYPNLKKFIFQNNNEYIFGDNIVNVEMINNSLEFIINKEKYNLEDFLKYFSNNNTKFVNTNEKNKEEQINGIETTAGESDKSENLIKEKCEIDKNNNNITQNKEDEENNDKYNSIRKQKRIKRKILIEDDEEEEQDYQETQKIKNGAESNEKCKK